MDKINIEEVQKIIGKLYMELYSLDKMYLGQISTLKNQLSVEIEKNRQLEKKINDSTGQREIS